MERERVYLDHNASAPLLADAREAMLAALALEGNASSVHAEGRALRRLVDEARRSVAALTGSFPAHVVFTSGATEAASTLLTPHWTMGRAPLRMGRLLIGATEHACVLSGGQFPREAVEQVPVLATGIVDLAALKAALTRHDPAVGPPLVALHAANNETGVIQPVREAAAIVRAAGGVLVVDAVQAAGRIPLDISDGYGDFLILSSHKIGGPKGAGAIVGASDLMMPEPLHSGGGQERGHRAGTENVAAIAGFGAAARLAMSGLPAINAVAAARDRFEAALLDLVPGAVIHGSGAPRLPNTLCFSLPWMKAETAQIAFDLSGVALGAGSACSSGKVGPSHVMAAMGLARHGGALRVSIGRDTSASDLDRFRDVLAGMVARRAAQGEAA